jgi:hypothetical protein
MSNLIRRPPGDRRSITRAGRAMTAAGGTPSPVLASCTPYSDRPAISLSGSAPRGEHPDGLPPVAPRSDNCQDWPSPGIPPGHPPGLSELQLGVCSDDSPGQHARAHCQGTGHPPAARLGSGSPGDCATSTSVPSDPLTGPASAGSARRPPPPDTGMIMIDQATKAAAYDGAAPSLRCWHPRGCTGREPPGQQGTYTGHAAPARTCWPRACPPAISATGARCSTCWPVKPAATATGARASGRTTAPSSPAAPARPPARRSDRRAARTGGQAVDDTAFAGRC